MKKLIASFAMIAFGALGASGASADGMARGGSVKDAPAAATCGRTAYNWHGAYAGVQVGASSYRSTTAIADVLDIAGSREDTSFNIGGVIGYNWQNCNTVFGLEADLTWANVDRDWGINLGGLGFGGLGQVFSANSSIDLYGAIKLRTGFAFDKMLLYVTGGVAFANIEHSGANNAIGGFPAGLVSFKSDETRWGWVVGAGTEYALTNRITWRSEATYTRFEDQSFNLNIAPLPGAAIKLNAQDEIWMLRSGLNFKF
jgi:outer membrane immunogenic protein